MINMEPPSGFEPESDAYQAPVLTSCTRAAFQILVGDYHSTFTLRLLAGAVHPHSQPHCKRGSVEDNHSSRPAVTGWLKHPTRSLRAFDPSRISLPIWACTAQRLVVSPELNRFVSVL